jgi:hypothetical protein
MIRPSSRPSVSLAILTSLKHSYPGSMIVKQSQAPVAAGRNLT